MFANTLKLVRFILRRDRISLPIWLISIIGFTAIMPVLFDSMYQSHEERQAMATTMDNPAITVMLGPGYGLDNYTIGAMTAHYMLLWMAAVVAIMNIFFVSRHTRADEESGRLELVRSLPVGRLSKLSATLIVAVKFNFIIGILSGLGLYATGVESIDLQGSLLFGAVLAVTGILFATVTALFAQLASTSRGTLAYSFVFLIVAYIVRGIGDVSNETLARISPLGLILRTETYVNNYWWPIWIILIEAVVVGFLAFYLNSIRDLGSGFIPTRPGRKTASIFLHGSLGLSWRLVRNMLIAWIAGVFLIAVAYGSIFGDIEGYLSSNQLLQAAFDNSSGDSLTEQFIPFLMVIMTMISAIPVISATLKVRSEEKHEYMEHLLVRAVSRYRIMANYLLIAFITSVTVCFLTAVGFWSASSSVLDNPIAFATFLKASMVYLPALWIMMGVGAFLVGFFPSLTSLAWVYLGYCFFASYFGQLIDLPEWMGKLTPFGYIPRLPLEDMDWSNVITLTIVAIVLVVGGLIGYRRRDIQG